MSSQKTEHLKMHRWEGEDKFLRTEMNENFAALDSAVAENAAKAAADLAAAREAVTAEISAASATLDGKISANAATAQNNLAAVQNSLAALSQTLNDHIVLGTYTGDGEATRTISLGFTPRALYVSGTAGEKDGQYWAYNGFALPGVAAVGVTIVENGFLVACDGRTASSTIYPMTNKKDLVCNFIALR